MWREGGNDADNVSYKTVSADVLWDSRWIFPAVIGYIGFKTRKETLPEEKELGKCR